MPEKEKKKFLRLVNILSCGWNDGEKCQGWCLREEALQEGRERVEDVGEVRHRRPDWDGLDSEGC